MNTLVNPKIKTTNKEQKYKEQQKSKKSSIIVSILIILILSYITFDYFYVKHKIESQIVLIDNKFDSLNTYVNSKIPMIDEILKRQEKQVEDIQKINDIAKN